MRLINPLNLANQLRKKMDRAVARPATLKPEEFESLLEPLKDGIYGFIFKSMGFSEDAGDVYQETVLRAFKYRNSFKRGLSFKSWIFSIAGNEIRRHFRKTSKAGLSDRVDVSRMIPSTADGSGKKVREIFEAAAGLTERQKRIFFLFYENQFSIREISRITGLSGNNIKVTLNQCRNRIRSHLGVSNAT